MSSVQHSILKWKFVLTNSIYSFWDFQTHELKLDNSGFGHGVYVVQKGNKQYSLVCFSNHLDENERSDRVIATKWDASFVLYDGIPSSADIQRLKENVPLQEQGRVTEKELCLSRANKSVRVFEHVVDQLSQGQQPDTSLLYSVGYLYRTTAVYGSGKFGLADRIKIQDREELKGPFRLEMMLVFLARQFTFDVVNHVAYHRSPTTSVKLSDDIARNLGIGNSTGLGMAPFIVNHPALLNQWIMAKEKALRAIRLLESVNEIEKNNFQSEHRGQLELQHQDATVTFADPLHTSVPPSVVPSVLVPTAPVIPGLPCPGAHACHAQCVVHKGCRRCLNM